MSPSEHSVRRELAACYRLVAMYGWDDLIFTHISARVPDEPGHFLINPYGMLFEEITASSLVKIDLQGQVVGASNYPVNPAGFVIHKASNAKRNRRTVIEAVGGVRQYKRMVYAERGLVYTAGNDCA